MSLSERMAEKRRFYELESDQFGFPGSIGCRGAFSTEQKFRHYESIEDEVDRLKWILFEDKGPNGVYSPKQKLQCYEAFERMISGLKKIIFDI